MKLGLDTRRLRSMLLGWLCILLCHQQVPRLLADAFRPLPHISVTLSKTLTPLIRSRFFLEAKILKNFLSEIPDEEKDKYFKLDGSTYAALSLADLVQRGIINFDDNLHSKKKKEIHSAKVRSGLKFEMIDGEESHVPTVDHAAWYRILTKASKEDSVADSIRYYSEVPNSILQRAIDDVFVPKAPSYFFSGTLKSPHRYLNVRYTRSRFPCCVFVKCTTMNPEIATDIETIEGVRCLIKNREGFVAPLTEVEVNLLLDLQSKPNPELEPYLKDIQMGEYVSIVDGDHAGSYGIVDRMKTNQLMVRIRSPDGEDKLEPIEVHHVRFLADPPEKHYRLLTPAELLAQLQVRDPNSPKIRTLIRAGGKNGSESLESVQEPVPFLKGSFEHRGNDKDVRNNERPLGGKDPLVEGRDYKRADQSRDRNRAQDYNAASSGGVRSTAVQANLVASHAVNSNTFTSDDMERRDIADQPVKEQWTLDAALKRKKAKPVPVIQQTRLGDNGEVEEDEILWGGDSDMFSAQFFPKSDDIEGEDLNNVAMKGSPSPATHVEVDEDLLGYDQDSTTVDSKTNIQLESTPPQPQNFAHFPDYINALVAYQKKTGKK